MTLQELIDWTKTATLVDCLNRRVNEDSTFNETRVYRVGFKHYAVDILHGMPKTLPEHPRLRYQLDALVVPPREVLRKTRMVEEVYVEDVKS